MNSREVELLRTAIKLIGPEFSHKGNNFENGMKILYRLAKMNAAADYITKTQNTPAKPITEFFTDYPIKK